MTDAPICRKCGVQMVEGVSLRQTFRGGMPDMGEIVTMYAGGPGKLAPCWKCPECGRSITKEGESE